MIKKAFTEHPASVGESYTEHMGMAFGFGSKMILAGCACVLHGIFPFWFKTNGSECIKALHDCMSNRNKMRDCQEMPSMEQTTPQAQPAE